mgnify:CR=1 FL=1
MRNDKRIRRSDRRGFTLLELLVVIGIVAMLVGILSVGLKNVVRQARSLKQRTILRSMDTGLELFAKDFEDYPESAMTSNSGSPPYVCGAQHLVEALVGRDGRGFEPKTKWYAPSADPTLYTDDQESLWRRKGPYTELKDAGAFLLTELYNSPATPLFSNDSPTEPLKQPRAPVFADIFHLRRVPTASRGTVYVGNPIVYFKADKASRFFGNRTEQPDHDKWIYRYSDCSEIFALGSVKDPAVQHRYAPDFVDSDTGETGPDLFYEAITNPTMATDRFRKPYNPGTFILMSAGWDGVFGTKDDVTNFN